MSTMPPAESGRWVTPTDSGRWVTPPPMDDGSSVWSGEEYSVAEPAHLSSSGYTGYSSYPRTSTFGYAPAYPYYTNVGAPGQPLPPYWPRAVAARPIDGYAITSLVFGILGGWLFGLGFGFAALRRIGRGVRRGRGIAIAGIWLSAIWIAVYAIVVPLYLRK